MAPKKRAVCAIASTAHRCVLYQKKIWKSRVTASICPCWKRNKAPLHTFIATTATGHVAYPIGMPRLSGHPDCFLVSNKLGLIAKLGLLVGRLLKLNPNRPLEPVQILFGCRHLACHILEGVAGYVERIRQARCRQPNERQPRSDANAPKQWISSLNARLGVKRQSLSPNKGTQGNERCRNGFREQMLG